MVPVREGQDDLLVIVILERTIRISDNERSTKAVRVLSTVVRVIPELRSVPMLADADSHSPVGPGLVNL